MQDDEPTDNPPTPEHQEGQGPTLPLPDDVTRLLDEGDVKQARALLRSYAKTERSPETAELQHKAVNDLRNWLQPIGDAPRLYTLNGIGTRLYGNYQPASDGTYIATLWFTLVFVPIWPIAAYLVQRAPGGGWHFLARSPIPPIARTMRRIVGPTVAAGIGFFFWFIYYSGTVTDLLAYNGFDRPVIATVGNVRHTVPPRQHVEFSDLPVARIPMTATWLDATTPFETLTVDLRNRGRELVVYNIASRAVMAIGYVMYGPGEPRDYRVLDGGPIIILDERLDYRFVEPPDSLTVPDGSSIEKSVLFATDEHEEPQYAVEDLLRMERPEQALALARAELLLHPENADLVRITVWGALGNDFDAQVELVRWCLERAPDVVDLHRYYQELWPHGDRDAIREEYAALLAEHPASPMHHYLVGRLEPLTSRVALRHYNEALRLDPDYAPAHRALGYHAARAGDWAQALAHYDRYASFGPEHATETLEQRLRLNRRLRRPRGLQRVLREAKQSRPENINVDLYEAHLGLEGNAASLDEHTDAVIRRADSLAGDFDISSFVLNTRAALAVTAGDLAEARRQLAELPDFQSRHTTVALRLALSEGATDDDVAFLKSEPNWFGFVTPFLRIVALELLDEGDRNLAIAETLSPDLIPLARALENPTDLTSTNRIAAMVADLDLDFRPAAFFAAAARLRNQTAPGAVRARRFFLAEAQSFSLPGELPFVR